MKNKFINNTFWIVGGQIVRMVISFFVGVLTVRYLGPDNYGVINYVNSYITFFTTLIGLGLNGVIIYEFVNHRQEEGEILGTAIFLRFLAGIISCVVFMPLIYLTDGGDNTVIIVAVLQSIQLPLLCFDTINYWYQAKLMSKTSSIIQTSAYLITAIYKVYLLVSGKNVFWFAAATVIDVTILAFLYMLSYFKNKNQPLKISVPTAKRMFRGCAPFILANMMVVIYGQIDKIMIKHILDSKQDVGLYSAALNICALIAFIPQAIIDSARPLIMEAKKKDEKLYQTRMSQLISGVVWINIIYSVFLTVLSKQIILLLYGDAYLSADSCLKIATWYTAFSFLGAIRSLWLICEEKNRYVFIFSAGGAVTNVLLNCIFIRISGINGAALATLLTQFLANFIYPLIFKNTRVYSILIIKGFFLRSVNIKELENEVMSCMKLHKH